MSFTETEKQRKTPKTEEKLPVVWVYKDPNVGDLNASKGIAERINPNYEIHDYNDIFPSNQNHKVSSKPDIIIGIGKPNRHLFDLTNPCRDAFFISHNAYAGADLCYGALSDNAWTPNFVTIDTPHAVTKEKIETGKREWGERFDELPEPKIAVLVGGTCTGFQFTPDMAREFAKQCVNKAKEFGGSLIVTTSRRTGKEATEAFLDEISKEYDVPAYIHLWKPEQKPENNPYYGILGLADAIIVTGDSGSMCNEVNASCKPVYVYDFGEKLMENYRKYHTTLYDRNVAKPFSKFLEKGIVPWDYEPLDTAGDIAKEALKRWREMQESVRTHKLG